MTEQKERKNYILGEAGTWREQQSCLWKFQSKTHLLDGLPDSTSLRITYTNVVKLSAPQILYQILIYCIV
jgi:hypothetical protein